MATAKKSLNMCTNTLDERLKAVAASRRFASTRFCRGTFSKSDLILEHELERLRLVLNRKRRVALSLAALEGKETVRVARLRQLTVMLRVLKFVFPFFHDYFLVLTRYRGSSHPSERDEVRTILISTHH